MIEINEAPYSTYTTLNVIVDKDDVVAEMDKMWKSMKNDIELKGHRKGSVSQETAESIIGASQLYRGIIDTFFQRALKEQYMQVIYVYKFGMFGEVKRGNNLEIYAVVELFPDVKLFSMNELNVDHKDNLTASDEEIENEFHKFMSSKMQRKVLSDRVIRNGDFIDIDFEGLVEGKPFEGGTAKNYRFVLGETSFVAGFEKLVGSSIGDELKIDIIFPETYRVAELRGKPATFNVKINNAQEQVYPEIDSKFLKKYNVESEDEFRNTYLRALAIESKRESYSKYFRDTVLKEFIEKSEISYIPEAILRDEININWVSTIHRVGMTEEEMIEKNFNNMKKTSIEEFKDDMHTAFLNVYYDHYRAIQFVDEIVKSFPRDIKNDVIKAKMIQRFKEFHYQKNKDVIDMNVRLRVIMSMFAQANNITVDRQQFEAQVDIRLTDIGKGDDEDLKAKLYKEYDNPTTKQRSLIEHAIDILIEKADKAINGDN